MHSGQSFVPTATLYPRRMGSTGPASSGRRWREAECPAFAGSLARLDPAGDIRVKQHYSSTSTMTLKSITCTTPTGKQSNET